MLAYRRENMQVLNAHHPKDHTGTWFAFAWLKKKVFLLDSMSINKSKDKDQTAQTPRHASEQGAGLIALSQNKNNALLPFGFMPITTTNIGSLT